MRCIDYNKMPAVVLPMISKIRNTNSDIAKLTFWDGQMLGIIFNASQMWHCVTTNVGQIKELLYVLGFTTLSRHTHAANIVTPH